MAIFWLYMYRMYCVRTAILVTFPHMMQLRRKIVGNETFFSLHLSTLGHKSNISITGLLGSLCLLGFFGLFGL